MEITRKEALDLSRKILLDAEKGRQIDALANSSFDIIHDALETVELLNEMGDNRCRLTKVLEKWLVYNWGQQKYVSDKLTILESLRNAKQRGWRE